MSEKGRNDKMPKTDVYVTDQGISTELMEQSAQHLIRILGEPDRMYKDHVFRMLLKDRHIALEAYNAMNGTNYTDPEELVIVLVES